MGLELLHLSYVKQWVVAPTYRDRNVAEHTFRTIVIADYLWNHLSGCDVVWADLINDVIHHDADERLTGDLPGPSKDNRPGYLEPLDQVCKVRAIRKVADSIETGTFWLQWGNPDAWTGHPYNRAPARDIEKIKHYATKIPGLLEEANRVWEAITGGRIREW